MFLKLICFGRKICIVIIEMRFKAIHNLQRRENLRLLLPPLFLHLFAGCRFEEPFSKPLADFQNVNVLKYLGYKCLSFPKLCGIPYGHAYEIYLYTHRKDKSGVFQFVFRCFPPPPPPPRPKMPFGQINVAI